MRRKTQKQPFKTSYWTPAVCDLETNICEWPGGDYDVFPIFFRGRSKLCQTGSFLDVSESGEACICQDDLPIRLLKLPLNDPESVEDLANGVANAPKEPLGRLRLMTTNTDNIVYIVASRAPAKKKLTGPKPANQLLPTPD